MNLYKLKIVKANGQSKMLVTQKGRIVCKFSVKTNFSFTIGHYSLILADSGACRAFLDNLSACMRDIVKNVWRNEAVWNEGFVVCAR
jgi:hypothetical protein